MRDDFLQTVQDSLKIPRHVAIVMDGNGRWAKNRHLPAIAGHRAGATATQNIVKRAAERGVEYITLYTFSVENWRREKKWIEDFMGLIRWYFGSHVEELMKNNVRIRVVGDITPFPNDVQNLLQNIIQRTSNNAGITVNLALGHSGRDDICRAVKKIAAQVQAGELQLSDINEACISNHLDTAGMPDPDLFIRTSGELRISNFLLWNISYTECVFTPQLWPDFTPDDFDRALQEFQTRQRRYGG